jgi:hypothetical protein
VIFASPTHGTIADASRPIATTASGCLMTLPTLFRLQPTLASRKPAERGAFPRATLCAIVSKRQ